jgi:hypothetical protein
VQRLLLHARRRAVPAHGDHAVLQGGQGQGRDLDRRHRGITSLSLSLSLSCSHAPRERLQRAWRAPTGGGHARPCSAGAGARAPGPTGRWRPLRARRARR